MESLVGNEKSQEVPGGGARKKGKVKKEAGGFSIFRLKAKQISEKTKISDQKVSMLSVFRKILGGLGGN